MVATVIVVALFAGAIWGAVYGIRWITAGPKGQLEAREQILSGDNRIQAYNHFFNLCAEVQQDEVAIESLQVQLEQASPDDHDRVLSFLTGTKIARGKAIAQYNADASKDYTIAQFKDLDLPNQLSSDDYKGVQTRCNFGFRN